MVFIINDQEDLLKTERLYEQYKSIMYRVAYNILGDNCLSENAVHTSFVKIIDNLHKIDEGNYTKTKNFLYIICRNVSLDIYKARFGTTELYNETEIEDSQLSPSEILINEEYLQCVSEAIEQLKPIYQDIIYLKFYHDYSTLEIAKLLNIEKEAVKKRIQRGKAHLHKILEKEEIIF